MNTLLIDSVHPGEILLEDWLKPMNISQYALAKAIGVPARRINEIVHGKVCGLLLTLILMGFSLSAHAAKLHTEPHDIVSIESTGYPPQDARPSYHKTYKKPWSKVKLDPQTLKQLQQLLAQTDYFKDSEATFRIAHLKLVNDEVQGVLFVSDSGAALGIELVKSMDSSRYCYTSLGGNGWMNAGCNKDPF